jgi:hypothetical protein
MNKPEGVGQQGAKEVLPSPDGASNKLLQIIAVFGEDFILLTYKHDMNDHIKSIENGWSCNTRDIGRICVGDPEGK